MGSHHQSGTTKKRNGLQSLIRLITLALVAAAVVKELRTPAQDRTWNGVVAGFVPYDFRVPTATRIRERMWAPHDRRVITPEVFGVGWTVNVGRLVALVRHKVTTTD
ncbi:DUF5808 domain-containing protein [Cellulomonas sp. P22]|uniref:DUF5808 domain-containing protein n=1 Tax=Cellulomonas sp. P22 TaxID=3373189 RepID=UPI00378964A2